MNAKERLTAVIQGKHADRVPVIPYISQFAAVDFGVNYTTFCKDAKILADTLLKCRDKYDYDALYISTDSAMECEPMGCGVRYFDDDVPTIDSHPWENKVLKDCSLPQPDPRKDGRMPLYQEAIRIMDQKTEGNIPIFAGSDGPLTICSHLRNINRLMMDLMDSPEDVARILKEAADVTLSFCLANAEAGATVCHFGDPEAALLGPAMYKEIIWPAHKKVVEGIQAKGHFVLGHFCGNTTAILDDLVNLGCDILNIDNQLGLDAAKKHASRVCLLGDLDPIRLLKEGTPDEIEKAIQSRMNDFKSTGKYMLGSGCHFPADMPPDNVRAFVESGKKYGSN